jgi:spermidine/putrescine transport system permease protein
LIEVPEGRGPRLGKRLVPYVLSLPSWAWLALFFIVPLGAILSLSLQTGNPIEGFRFTWNVSTYWDAIRTYDVQFVRSFLYGGSSTALALVAMYPVAYWIAFRGGSHKSTFLFIVLLPFFVSFIIRILTWQFILADEGIVLGSLKDIGLLPESLHVLSTSYAVIAGLTYDALPFMVLPIFVALERIDRDVIEAAADLYANARERFRRVILPLSAPGVYAGVLLVFVTNVGDYLAAEILGGPGTTMIGNIIQTQYLQNQNYPMASALSTLLMVGMLVVMYLYARAFGARSVEEYVG